MNPLTRLFRKQSAPQGVTLEIQSGFTAFSGTAYGSAAFRSAVDAIARHAAKLQGHADEPGLERLLRESPNARVMGPSKLRLYRSSCIRCMS